MTWLCINSCLDLTEMVTNGFFVVNNFAGRSGNHLLAGRIQHVIATVRSVNVDVNVNDA